MALVAGGLRRGAERPGQGVHEDGRVDRGQQGDRGQEADDQVADPPPPAARARRQRRPEHDQTDRRRQARPHRGTGAEREHHPDDQEDDHPCTVPSRVAPDGDEQHAREGHEGVAGRDRDVLHVEHRVAAPHRQRRQDRAGHDRPAPRRRDQPGHHGRRAEGAERQEGDTEVAHDVGVGGRRHLGPRLVADDDVDDVQEEGRDGRVDVGVAHPGARSGGAEVVVEEVPALVQVVPEPDDVERLIDRDTDPERAGHRHRGRDHDSGGAQPDEPPGRLAPRAHAPARFDLLRACTTSSASSPKRVSWSPTTVSSTPASSSGRPPIGAPASLTPVR